MVTMECLFKKVKMYLTFVDFKGSVRLGESASGKLYIAAVLLANL